MAERIVDLDEIGNKWFFTVVFSDMRAPSELDGQLISILNQDQRLQSLIAQTVYHAWDNNTEMVQTAVWKKALGTDRPSVILQSPADEKGNSKVVFFASGVNVHPDQRLAREIQLSINKFKVAEKFRRPFNPRPTPEPNPAPKPNPKCPLHPKPAPIPAPVPTKPQIPQTPVVESEEQEAPTEKYIPLWAFFLPAVGAGLGLRRSLKNEMSTN